MKVIFGFDSDGDLCASIDGEIHAFYKWAESTLLDLDPKFTALTDANAKNLWRRVRDAIEEFKEEEGLE